MFDVLLADDDATFRLMVAKLLTAAGFRVETADDGQAAFQRLADKHFDVLVTDIVMPHMDGIELIRAVQKVQPNLTILAMSGVGPDVDYLVAASAFGAGATVSKREALTRLVPTLNSLVAGR